MTQRRTWDRPFRSGIGVKSWLVYWVLNHHFSGHPQPDDGDSKEWFPVEYRRPHDDENYLVPPWITDASLHADNAADLKKVATIFGGHSNENEWTVTEETWGRISWNPRIVYEVGTKTVDLGNGRSREVRVYNRKEVEFTRSPSPSWRDLQTWERDYQIDLLSSTGNLEYISGIVKDARDTILRMPVTHPVDGEKEIDAGGGIAHMPALAYIAHRSSHAGVLHPRVVLRGSDGGTTDLWHEAETHDFLESMASYTNHIESGRNVVEERIGELLSVAASDTATVDERRRALDDAHALTVPSTLDTAILDEARSMVDPDGLPKGLERVKSVLVGRLEAVAMRRVKFIRGAVSQQRIDMKPACQDMGSAENRVANEEMKGQIEIERAGDDIYRKDRGLWVRIPDDDTDIPLVPTHEGEDVPAAALGANGDTYLRTGTGLAEAQTPKHLSLIHI